MLEVGDRGSRGSTGECKSPLPLVPYTTNGELPVPCLGLEKGAVRGWTTSSPLEGQQSPEMEDAMKTARSTRRWRVVNSSGGMDHGEVGIPRTSCGSMDSGAVCRDGGLPSISTGPTHLFSIGSSARTGKGP